MCTCIELLYFVLFHQQQVYKYYVYMYRAPIFCTFPPTTGI